MVGQCGRLGPGGYPPGQHGRSPRPETGSRGHSPPGWLVELLARGLGPFLPPGEDRRPSSAGPYSRERRREVQSLYDSEGGSADEDVDPELEKTSGNEGGNSRADDMTADRDGDESPTTKVLKICSKLAKRRLKRLEKRLKMMEKLYGRNFCREDTSRKPYGHHERMGRRRPRWPKIPCGPQGPRFPHPGCVPFHRPGGVPFPHTGGVPFPPPGGVAPPPPPPPTACPCGPRLPHPSLPPTLLETHMGSCPPTECDMDITWSDLHQVKDNNSSRVPQKVKTPTTKAPHTPRSRSEERETYNQTKEERSCRERSDDINPHEEQELFEWEDWRKYLNDMDSEDDSNSEGDCRNAKKNTDEIRAAADTESDISGYSEEDEEEKCTTPMPYLYGWDPLFF